MIKHKEIILVRVLGSNRELIINEVNKMISEIRTIDSQISIEVYCSITFPTDFSVHIDYYDSEKSNNAPSDLGHRLAEALKEFGLISHSVWSVEKMK